MKKELTQEQNEQVNRIVNGNFMISLINVLKEDLEYFRGQYGGNEKNVFKRIVTNCDVLFNPAKMNDVEMQETETISDAMINAIYDLRTQYRTHVENQMINNKIK